MRRGLLCLGVVLASAYALLFRPWQLRWGASDAEAQQSLPGDDLVPSAWYQTTRAITVHAPPAAVWPWLVQMGQGRGGLYTYDRLERLVGVDLHNVDVIVPELQHVSVGQTLPLWQGSSHRVAVLESERALVLHDSMDLFTAQPVDPADTSRPTMAWTWAFVLHPIGARGTRLLVRTRADLQPRAMLAPTVPLLLEPMHFIMERGMLLGIRRRAEQVHLAGPGSPR